MIIFLPCFDTCIDGLDTDCSNHKQTLLFFNELANERQKNNPNEVVLETRAWDPETETTFSLRKKESEEEYGYIIDPDLISISISEDYISKIKESLPELAHEKTKKFIELGLKEEDARIIAQGKELAELFEKAIEEGVNAQLATTWIRHEMNRVLNYNKKTLDEIELEIGRASCRERV